MGSLITDAHGRGGSPTSMRARPQHVPGEVRRRRRGRQTSPSERRAIWGIAALAAVAGAFAPGAPTGLVVMDVVLRAAFAAGVTLAASRARRWAWLVMSGLVVLGAEGPWLVVAGAGLLFALVAALLERRRIYGAVVGAVVVQAMLHLSTLSTELGSFLLVVVAVAPVVVSAYVVSPKRVRKRLLWATGGVAALALVGAVCFAVSAGMAMRNMTRAADDAQDGLDAARDGRPDRAAELLESSAASFRKANATLTAWWAKPALAVPVVAQNAQAAIVVSEQGEAVTTTAAASAALADFDRLRYDDGRIDLDQIRTLADPLAGTASALGSASDRVGEANSPWLVAPIAKGLVDFRSELDKARPEAELAAAATAVAPGMLGGDGTRRYFVAFTTPAEMRGLGGFMGDWAEITATDGKLEMTRHGRTEELRDVPGAALRTVSGPADYLARYARYKPWEELQDITFSPDMPSVAQVMGELYPQMGGEKLDGMMVVDPYALAAFLRFTGPIEVDGLDEKLTPENAADILVRKQYTELTDRDTRQDFLDQASEITFEKLVTGDIPGPRKVADTLYPMVRDRHLMFSSLVGGEDQAAEDAFIGRLGASGAFPTKGDHDFFALTTSNSANNKIDVFLKRTVDYKASFNPDTGTVDAKVKVQLKNEAPAEGLPESVIGSNDKSKRVNPLALGTNQLYFSFYTPLGLRTAMIDGETKPLEYQVEHGWSVYSRYLTIPAGETVTVELNLFGDLQPGSTYALDVITQPTVNPDKVSASVTLPSEWRVVDERRTTTEGFGVGIRGDEAVLAVTGREPVHTEIDVGQR